MRIARLLCALALAATVAGACKKGETPPLSTQANALADSADQVMYKARFSITDGGTRRADVEGDTAYFFNQGTRLIIRPLRGTFFSSNGAKDGIIQAREGTYDTRVGVLEARGDVLVNSLDGKRLETPFAKFDQRANQISSDTSFTFSEPSREIRGIGFTSDADLSTMRVAKMLSAKAGAVAVP
jgi:LPS export ABC transporter protein LptC